MPIPQDHVAQVAAFLSGGSGTAKEKLITGWKMLWAATVLTGEWTPELLAKARKSLAALTQGNKIDMAIARLDEATANKAVKQFAKEVAELAEGVAQAKGRKRAGVVS